MCQKVHRLALPEACICFLVIVFGWQCGKNRSTGIYEGAFQCIMSGCVAPSCGRRMLGWAMLQKLHPPALADAELYFIVLVLLFSFILRMLGK